MRYCYNCNRITHGEPLFCQFCGRSYSVKLCPRLHKNPRNAQICSKCGSRELSTPAPKQPFWISVAVFGLSLVPGILLVVVSIAFVAAMLEALVSSPRLLLAFGFLALALIVLWAMWMRLPLALRRFLRRLLLDRKKGRRP